MLWGRLAGTEARFRFESSDGIPKGDALIRVKIERDQEGFSEVAKNLILGGAVALALH
jgi:hypothetical protein